MIGALLSITMFWACDKDEDSEPEEIYTGISLQEFIDTNYPGLEPVDESGVYVVVTREGTGDLPQQGETLYCYYKGKLLDGTPFDTTHQRPADEDLPQIDSKSLMVFEYNDTLTSYIPGWYKGFGNIKKGSEAIFILPAEQAYGDEGTASGTILPGAPIMFEVELINIR